MAADADIDSANIDTAGIGASGRSAAIVADLEDSSVSWAVSLCFWFALLLAAAVYGAVALAPKFSVWHEVRSEYRHNVNQLVALEDDVEYLERVETALKTDPEFVQRLAGVSRHSEAEGEELIPVSGSLLFGQSDEDSAAPAIATAPPLFHGIILRVASDTRLRTILLSFSACLTVFAFTFLNDAGRGFVYATGSLIKAVVMLPVNRYVRDVAVDRQLPETRGASEATNESGPQGDTSDEETSVSGRHS